MQPGNADHQATARKTKATPDPVGAGPGQPRGTPYEGARFVITAAQNPTLEIKIT